MSLCLLFDNNKCVTSGHKEECLANNKFTKSNVRAELRNNFKRLLLLLCHIAGRVGTQARTPSATRAKEEWNIGTK